jgi:hypothetical protein
MTRAVHDELVDSDASTDGALGVLARDAQEVGPILAAARVRVQAEDVGQEVLGPLHRDEGLARKGAVESEEPLAEADHDGALGGEVMLAHDALLVVVGSQGTEKPVSPGSALLSGLLSKAGAPGQMENTITDSEPVATIP